MLKSDLSGRFNNKRCLGEGIKLYSHYINILRMNLSGRTRREKFFFLFVEIIFSKAVNKYFQRIDKRPFRFTTEIMFRSTLY